MVREMKIGPSEDLAPMIEYTTGESKRLIQRLRNAYIVNLAEGVKESWKSLGKRFGSTAMISGKRGLSSLVIGKYISTS